MILKCAKGDPETEVRATALGLLRDDPRLREELREKAIDTNWLQEIYPHADSIIKILSKDEASWPVFRAHVDTAVGDDNDDLLALSISALEHDTSMRSRIRGLLRHDSLNVQIAAIGALRRDRASREHFLSLLGSSDKNLRKAAADVLRDVHEAQSHYTTLIGDRELEIRRIAIGVLRKSRDPESLEILLRRVPIEKNDRLRDQLLSAVAGAPGGIEILQARLQKDLNSHVRKTAAAALGRKPSEPMQPLVEVPSVRLVMSQLRGEPMACDALTRLSAFLGNPTPLDLDVGSELGDAALAWLCLRLAWASKGGQIEDGRPFGEVMPTVERLDGPGQVTVIHVAMDASDLPRERLLRPTHNLVEAWRVAQHLRFADPPSLILACADAGPEHLSPPAMEPASLCWGPTFFGCRLPDR